MQGLLQCCSLNARSVMNKKLDIQALLVEERLDVLAVTETFLGDEILDSELLGGDYTIFRRDRNRHGGGVMLYVKNSISAIRRRDLETNCEVLWVELSTGPRRCYWEPSTVHLAPCMSISPSLRCHWLPSRNLTLFVLCGDLNLPHLDWAEPSSHPPPGWLVQCWILPKTSPCSSLSLNRQGVHTHLTCCSPMIQTVSLVCRL